MGLSLAVLPCVAMAYSNQNEQSYRTSAYIGAQASYLITKDKAAFANTNKKNTRHDAVFSGFIGYGKVTNDNNLPYLGVELGYQHRDKYNGGSNIGEGNLNGRFINADWAVSADILPGLFYDDAHTLLIYGRAGLERDHFKLTGAGNNMSKNKLMYRLGVGLEQQLLRNFYLRLDYTLSLASNAITFNQAGTQYSSKPMFNAIGLGLSYRF